MVKLKFALLCVSPALIGICYSLLSGVPYAGKALYYFLPLVMLFYWYWVGRVFCRWGLRLFPAAVQAHIVGVIWFFLYLWQYYFTAEPNYVMSSFSVAYTLPVSILTEGLAGIFEPVEGIRTHVTNTASQILSLVLYAVVFSLGFSSEKKSVS